MKRLAMVLAVIALLAAACGGSDDGGGSDTTSAPSGGGGIAAEGERIYGETCSSCHGVDAQGVTGVGPALVDNAFIQSVTDEELVAFLRIGRPADDPANTTGIQMPPKGGNPALTDTDLRDVAAYLRTLQP